MDIQTLSSRISECLDDLGLLLDQIYKFPHKQREAYFEKIHSLKNKLLMLKSTLREYPPHNSEKQYKQLYLAMNALKNELTLQTSALTVSKENREAHNRTKDAKQTKRNYDDALRVIVERQEELKMVRLQLTQKQEIIRGNFSQISRMKTDLQILIQENRRLKFEQTTLQLELDSTRAAIDRNSDISIQFRAREQQKDLAFATAVEEIQHLKMELIAANQKLAHFQQLAQVSIRKTKMVEENIKKVEKQAQDLNDNYRMRESDNFRKMKEIGELQFQLGMLIDQNRQLQLQNRRLRQDIQVLQSQIIKGSKNFNEKMVQASQQRERIHQQVKRLVNEIQSGVLRETELKKVIQQSEKKYLLVISKLNSLEEVKVRNRELEIKIQSLEQRLKRTQSLLEQSKKQCIHIYQQKQRLAQELQRHIRSNRQAQIEVFKFRQKAKLKEQQRGRLMQEVELFQSKLKQSQRALAIQEVASQALEKQVLEERGRIAKGEQRQKIKEKQIQGLKIKLLHAKIQTVHEIREVISG